VPPANDNLKDDSGVGRMTALHVDVQSRQGLQQPIVKCADFVTSGVVYVPWLIVVARGRSERPHDAFKVMMVLETDVLVDKLDASRHPGISIHFGHDPSDASISRSLKNCSLCFKRIFDTR
jgi:hypothetical protein